MPCSHPFPAAFKKEVGTLPWFLREKAFLRVSLCKAPKRLAQLYKGRPRTAATAPARQRVPSPTRAASPRRATRCPSSGASTTSAAFCGTGRDKSSEKRNPKGHPAPGRTGKLLMAALLLGRRTRPTEVSRVGLLLREPERGSPSGTPGFPGTWLPSSPPTVEL